MQINAERSLEGLSDIQKTESQELEADLALLNGRKQEKSGEPKAEVKVAAGPGLNN